jgi:Tol biopolymer transport system component
MVPCLRFFAGACLALALIAETATAGAIGLFDVQSDIGSVVPPGSASYDPATDSYTIASAGADTWNRVDGFHFLWTKVTGDVALTARISFPPAAYSHVSNPNRKGLLMFRQGLDAGSRYADAALHASGFTALQYRREKGANTEDIELNGATPETLRLEKRGDTMTLYIGKPSEPLHQVGASVRLHLDGPFYGGLGVTAHDPDTTDKIVFSHVKLEPLAPLATPMTEISTLQTIQIDDQARIARVVLTKQGVFESPNYAPDGKSLVVNENGRFWRIPLSDDGFAAGAPVPFDTGREKGCWGEHGFSPDGKSCAISCPAPRAHKPDVFILPADGGQGRRLTHHPISFFHGWSPDGQTIAFTSIRDGHEDIYAIPAAGGAEARLTNVGVNDSGEYTPDGRTIYFNSDRSGAMQIWRMHPDGGGQEQVTSDDYANWYPHISPDGKKMVFLSYLNGDAGLHPANKDVALRIMSLADGEIRTLAEFTGGQGTIDSPCWAPDSDHLAFVSNQMLPAGDPK